MPEYPERIVLGEGWPLFGKKNRGVCLENDKGSALKRLNNPHLEDGPEAEGITYRLVLERVANNRPRR
ncbi:MAG: hypothetical protein M0P73_14790 [Syntrophobacterales bacterium]|jgi:hypothetical protein|nr:hypothetical protein [Syntrophobacterales bacterium]